MNIGLCLYPSNVLDRSGKLRATRLSGWRWSSFCKTQYASDPSLGDVANFVRCHVSIVQLLDHAQSLGVIEEVNDEGGYYEQRDIEALIREVTKWNEAIAGFAGSLKDRIGGDLQAAITRFSNFEHLEARGRRDEDAG